MRLGRLFLSELSRLWRSYITWLVVGLTLCAPAIGYSFITLAVPVTKASVNIANPSLSGALCGAMLFALLTLYELSRIRRNNMSLIADSIVSPITLHVIKLLALLCIGFITTCSTMLLFLPYTAMRMGQAFLPILYVQSYLVFMAFAIAFACIAAAAFYQISQRTDVAFVLFFCFFVFGLLTTDSFLLRWASPLVPVFSDDFSNARVIRMAMYNRLFWVLALGGVWLMSLFCVRRYGFGLIGSILRNVHKSLYPILAVILILCSGFTYTSQPFIDNSPPEYIMDESAFEYNEQLVVTDMNADVTLNANQGTLSGIATYEIENTGDTDTQAKLTVIPGYAVYSAKLNGQPIQYTDLNNDLNNAKDIVITIPAGIKGSLAVEYGGYPKEWSMSKSLLMGSEISEAYVCLDTKSVVPMLNAAGKAELRCNVTMPKHMALISGRPTTIISENSNGTNTWQIVGVNVIPRIHAGDYVMESFKEQGMAIEFYYSRKHKETMDKLGAIEMIRTTLQYCAEQYGPLPFDESNPLKLLQATAYLMGGQAGGNMSIMGEMTFNEENLNDPARGAKGAEVLAHEIIHQWWGLTFIMPDEGEWSNEGLTCYTTYRLMKKLYGEAYAKEHYVDLWQDGYDAYSRSFYQRNPEYVEVLPENYAAVIRMSEFSTLRYNVMPLKLLKAAELLGGEDKLDAVLSDLFHNIDPMAPFMTYDSFLKACNLTREDLNLD